MKVMENRGCDIRYDIFEGTYEECLEWLKNHGCRPWNELYPCGSSSLFFRRDEDGNLYANGDGDPFDYQIQEEV